VPNFRKNRERKRPRGGGREDEKGVSEKLLGEVYGLAKGKKCQTRGLRCATRRRKCGFPFKGKHVRARERKGSPLVEKEIGMLREEGNECRKNV